MPFLAFARSFSMRLRVLELRLAAQPDPARHCCVLLRMPMQLVPPSSSHPLELWRVSVHFAPAFASRPSCVLVLVVLASWMLLPILAAAGLKPYIPGPQTMNRKPCTSCLALPCLVLPCLVLSCLALSEYIGCLIG